MLANEMPVLITWTQFHVAIYQILMVRSAEAEANCCPSGE